MENWNVIKKTRIRKPRYKGAGSGGHEGLIWSPFKVRPDRRPAGGERLPEKTILKGNSQQCGFCSGTGSRKGAMVCPVCKGKGQVYIKTGTAIVCGFCRGTGEDKPGSAVTCLVCKGAGVVAVEEPIEVCPQCNGRGRESDNTNLYCAGCKGKGVISVKPGMRKFFGRPSGTAGDIARVVYDMEEAGKTQIARRLGLTSDYVAFVCESMIKKGYLEKVARGIYVLTPECEALMGKDEAAELGKLTREQAFLLRVVEEEEEEETTIPDLSARANLPVDKVQKICETMGKKDFLDVLLNGRIRLARKGMKALEKDEKSVVSGQ